LRQLADPPRVKTRANAKGAAQMKRAAPSRDLGSCFLLFINSCASAAPAQARSKART